VNYGLKPDDAARMDPDLVRELLIRLGAQAEVTEARQKQAEREAKRRVKGGRRGDDASIAEIT